MRSKTYTFFITSNNQTTVRKLNVPVYVLHLMLALTVVGGLTVLAAVGSYSRMALKAANYNNLRQEQARLKLQYQQLQATVSDTNQRLDSLQSLATEVAMTYGFMSRRETPFAQPASLGDASADYERTLAQYDFLMKNATAMALASEGLRLMPSPGIMGLGSMPSLWPVMGHISGSFGERLDPFSGEGTFHTGVDISSGYGDEVRATADGVVTIVDTHAGYGRVVVVDHGFGVSTLYGHLSAYHTEVGAHVKRGDVIGYVGVSGRTTGPHVHYEVRIHGAPVNPWRYLRSSAGND